MSTICDQIKYVGIYLDNHLNGPWQPKLIMQKLARALAMLSKVRHHVRKSELYLNHTFVMIVKFGSSLSLNISRN